MCRDGGWGQTHFSRDMEGKEQLQEKIKLSPAPTDQ